MDQNKFNDDFESTMEVPVVKPDETEKTLIPVSKSEFFADKESKIDAPDYIEYTPSGEKKESFYSPEPEQEEKLAQRMWIPICVTCIAVIVMCFALITTYVWPVLAQNGLLKGFVKIVSPIVGIEQPAEDTNVLLVGVDKDGYRTDAIMVARYNNEEKTVSVLQIPRDTYVGGNGRRDKKVNSAYFTGIDQLKKEIKLAYGISIDKYAAVELDGFKKIVDLLGGVEVDVPINMNYDDPYQDLHIHLKKGTQVLNGEQAEGFVRFRKNNDGSGFPRGDIQRMESQKNFVMSVIKKVASGGIGKVPELIQIANNNFKTDLEYSEILSYAVAVLELPDGGITFLESPGEMAYQSGWYFFVDKAGAKEVAVQHFGAADDVYIEDNTVVPTADGVPHENQIPDGGDISEDERESYYTPDETEEETTEEDEDEPSENDGEEDTSSTEESPSEDEEEPESTWEPKPTPKPDEEEEEPKHTPAP